MEALLDAKRRVDVLTNEIRIARSVLKEKEQLLIASHRARMDAAGISAVPKSTRIEVVYPDTAHREYDSVIWKPATIRRVAINRKMLQDTIHRYMTLRGDPPEADVVAVSEELATFIWRSRAEVVSTDTVSWKKPSKRRKRGVKIPLIDK